MQNLSMCRVCLATDVRLCSVARSLQDIYEKLTGLKLKKEDRKSFVACYICHARLQNCYRLRMSCLRGKKLLTKMLSDGELVPQQVSSTNRFTVVSTLHLSLEPERDSTECHIKEEALEVIHDAEFDQENTRDIKMESQEEQDAQIDDDIQYSQLEDPLDITKTEPDDVEIGVCRLKKLAEIDTPFVTESENVNKSIVEDGIRTENTVGVSLVPTSNALVVNSEIDVRQSTSGVTKTLKPVPRGKKGDGSDLDSENDDEFDISPVETTAVTRTRKEIPEDEELEEPLRDIFNNIGRGIDDEIDRLSGITDGFDWVEGFESFRGVPEAFSGPTPGPIRDYDSAYDAFTDIWDEDIINRIVVETNRYAKQTIDALKSKGELKPSSRMHEWVDTDADEIMVLLGVYMFMAIDPRTSIHEYWTTGVLGMPSFRRLLSYNRYILLNKFLHFVDNSDDNQNLLQNGETDLAKASRKLSKLMPIIKHLEKKFDSLYNLGRNIAIDESLTLFKGLSWVQTIRSKAWFGIKSYELCESQTGYMARFQINTGSSELQDPSVSVDLGSNSAKVVLELLQGLERQGHCVTMDNFYNCPAFARYLKRSGFDCLGTLRSNRRYVPNNFSEVPKDVPKGTIIARQSGDLSILAWKDSKLVTIISTFHDDGTCVGSKAGKVQVKPVSVRDYNSTMGSLDLKNQKLSMYLLERERGTKWYVKMFKRLLNVSIDNALIMLVSSLRRRDRSVMTHRELRYELAQSLIEKRRPLQRLQINEPVGQLTRLRRDIMHVPKHERGNVRKRCVICLRMKIEKKVRSRCTTCDIFLCYEKCWAEWHSAEQLKSQETRGRKRRRHE